MRNFYKASAKFPESPYPPALSRAPAAVAAGRPSFSGATWKDPDKAYFDQKDSTLPFKSTYERLAGGTSHWMGLTPRLVPNDFRMNEQYKLPFPDWPISYETLMPWYEGGSQARFPATWRAPQFRRPDVFPRLRLPDAEDSAVAFRPARQRDACEFH